MDSVMVDHSALHAVLIVLVSIFVVFVIAALFARKFIGGMFGLYRIVPVGEAHIRVLSDKKEIFSARTERSSYWYIPFMTQLSRLPLTNLAISVENIKLNDSAMAKFECDIICFVNIDQIALAAERLSLTDADDELGFDFPKLSGELKAIVESIGRTVAAKQTLMSIYTDRATLSGFIIKEISEVFPQWGLALVNLELKHIKDAAGSTIISDIERIRAAEIRRDADIKTAQVMQESQIAVAKSEEAYKLRQVEKDRMISLAEASKLEETAAAHAKANTKQIAAMRELEFGKAEIAREVAGKNAEARKLQLTVEAEGQRQKLILEAEGESRRIIAVGEANAGVIRASKLAEAEGTEKLAAAMAKFNDAAIGVKKLDIEKEVQIAKFQAFGQALSKAEIKWILSGSQAQKFFGLGLDGESGANLNQFFEEAGIDLEKIRQLLPAPLKQLDKK